MKNEIITIIIPVYNGESTLEKVFDSLEKQNYKNLIYSIYIINDNSNDGSDKIITKYLKNTSFKLKYIIHEKSYGLAGSYNECIKKCNSDFFILMHQDIILLDNDCFRKAVNPMLNDNSIVGTFPIIHHQPEIREKYNLYQKGLFSSFVGKNIEAFISKFDCIRKIDGLLFDNYVYRTAGEDFDYQMRLLKFGKIICSNSNVSHIHNLEIDFGPERYIKKRNQLAEDFGVNLRRYWMKYHIFHPLYLAQVLFRHILIFLFILGIFLKNLYAKIAILFIFILFIIFYSKKTYIYYINKGDYLSILKLFYVNCGVFFSHIYFFTRGFITGRQKI